MEGRSMSNDRALHRSQKRRVTTFYSVLLDLPIITFVTQWPLAPSLHLLLSIYLSADFFLEHGRISK